MIRTALLETPKLFESSFISSLLAAPSTGGAEIFTFRASSYSPTIPLFDERGMTRTPKVIESEF